MNDILQWFYLLFDNWLLLFLFLFILGVINAFLPPIPLEGLTLLGGYLSGTGHGNLSAVWLGPSLGMILGSMLLFLVFRFNKEWLFRWKLFQKHLKPEDLDKSQAWFERYGIWAIFLSRFIPGMGLVTISTAGLSKISWYRILPVIGFVNLLYFGGTIFIGRFANEEWEMITSLLKPILSWTGGAIIIIGAVFFLIWRSKKRKNLRPKS